MNGKRRWRRSKKAAREYERLKQEIADKEAMASRESKTRQERIKVLWDLDEKKPKAAKTYEARRLVKEQKLEELLNYVTDSTDNSDFRDQIIDLVELVGLQDRDIEHMRRHHELCEWAKTHAPEKLDAIEYAHSRHLVEGIWRFNLGPKLTPKQKGELERQGYNWRGVGLIEYEFGGKGEAEWRKLPLSGAFSELYRPTCLDEILRSGVGKIEKLPGFTGGLPITTDTGTNMQRLQELFGMHRNRFYKYLRDSENTRSGRKRLYGYRHILQIMKGLLSENTRKRTAARGAPRRIWLSDPDDPNLRTRVLSGIAGRINSVSVSNDIGRAFLEVVRPHLSDSAKK